ncbi:MAG: hypothetical protein Q4D98_09890 [Planctomycetia bacterium]|nr:hypothetical protein [Planctomycetia bacterium]
MSCMLLSSRYVLTARQKEILDFIRAFRSSRGFSPTIREIGHHLHLFATNSVVCHLTALEKKGFIRREANLSRSITLLENQAVEVRPEVPEVEADIVDGLFCPPREKLCPKRLSSLFLRENRHLFLLRVGDERFSRYAILAGDFLLVRRTRTASPGEMAVLRDGDGGLLMGRCMQDAKTGRTFLRMADMHLLKTRKNQGLCGVLLSVIRPTEQGIRVGG